VPPDAEASPVMPELVIEVLSKSNTAAEIEEKQRLYFEAGAIEFWTCAADGKIAFYTADAPAEASALVPGFPERID
jgi:Uma2 family endonuclease